MWKGMISVFKPGNGADSASECLSQTGVFDGVDNRRSLTDLL